jgi:hypothetical protein
MPAPTITAVSPDSGTAAGGNPVVITGTNFTNPAVTSVTFDGTAAAFSINSGTRITATAPAHATGSVTVAVTNASGTATATYSYRTGLTLAPTTGAQGGGTTVDIYGSNLAGTTAVKFGTRSATFTQLSGTHVQAVSPSGAGSIGVTVAAPGGTSAPASFFYVNPPLKTELSPSAGALGGGTLVTISGRYLSNAVSVDFGDAAGTIASNDDGAIAVSSPPGAESGPASVLVTTPGGTTDGLTFTYTNAPTITGVTPITGTTAGGTTVTITGTNLSTTTQVTFGGTTATPFAALSDTKLVVVTPPHALGIVNVVVTNPAGSATATGAFTYLL